MVPAARGMDGVGRRQRRSAHGTGTAMTDRAAGGGRAGAEGAQGGRLRPGVARLGTRGGDRGGGGRAVVRLSAAARSGGRRWRLGSGPLRVGRRRAGRRAAPGVGSTDFWGIPFASSDFDRQPMAAAEPGRALSPLQACWACVGEVRARISAELRKGPRGGEGPPRRLRRCRPRPPRRGSAGRDVAVALPDPAHRVPCARPRAGDGGHGPRPGSRLSRGSEPSREGQRPTMPGPLERGASRCAGDPCPPKGRTTRRRRSLPVRGWGIRSRHWHEVGPGGARVAQVGGVESFASEVRRGVVAVLEHRIEFCLLGRTALAAGGGAGRARGGGADPLAVAPSGVGAGSCPGEDAECAAAAGGGAERTGEGVEAVVDPRGARANSES